MRQRNETRKTIRVARALRTVGSDAVSWCLFNYHIVSNGTLPRCLSRLDGLSCGAPLAFAIHASNVLLANLLAVASIPNLSGLARSILLANTVLANQVGSTAVGGMAEVTFTTKYTITLFHDIGVQRYRCHV